MPLFKFIVTIQSFRRIIFIKQIYINWLFIKNFNTIYIEEVRPLREYLIDASHTSINIQSLFDFIVNYNVLIYLDSLDEKEEEVSDSDD